MSVWSAIQKRIKGYDPKKDYSKAYESAYESRAMRDKAEEKRREAEEERLRIEARRTAEREAREARALERREISASLGLSDDRDGLRGMRIAAMEMAGRQREDMTSTRKPDGWLRSAVVDREAVRQRDPDTIMDYAPQRDSTVNLTAPQRRERLQRAADIAANPLASPEIAYTGEEKQRLASIEKEIRGWETRQSEILYNPEENMANRGGTVPNMQRTIAERLDSLRREQENIQRTARERTNAGMVSQVENSPDRSLYKAIGRTRVDDPRLDAPTRGDATLGFAGNLLYDMTPRTVNASDAFLSDEEASNYIAMAGAYGEEAANRWLASNREELNARAAKATNDLYDIMGGFGDFMQTVNAIPAGIANAGYGLVQPMKGEANPRTVAQMADTQARQNMGFWQGAAHDLLGSTTEMAPSIVVSFVPGVGTALGLGMTAKQVMGNTYAEAVRSGASEYDARSYALASGITEGAMQYVLGGVQQLGGKAWSAAGKALHLTPKTAQTAANSIAEASKRFATRVLRQGAEEGVEEYLTEQMDVFWRNTFLDEDNQIDIFNPDALYAAMLGFASGGLLEVGGAASEFSGIESDASPEHGSAPSSPPARQTAPAQQMQTNADNRQQTPTPARRTQEPAEDRAAGRKAVYAPSGETVELRRDFTTEDGEVYFPTDEGGSMAMEDMEFEDGNTAALYSHAANYATPEARAFVSNYDGGMSVDAYARGFDAIRRAAHADIDLDATVAQSLYARQIPENARRMIYQAAVNARDGVETNATAQEAAVRPQIATVRYRIAEDEAGRYVDVETDQDIFDGAASKDMPRIAREYLRSHFRNQYIGEGAARSHVSSRSIDEYTHPANRRVSEEVRTAKMRASTELDNLLTVSTFLEHRDDDGRHKEAVGGWDSYQTVFKVGGHYFKGTVLILRGDGYQRLYDITHIEKADGTRGLSGNPPNATSVGQTVMDTTGSAQGSARIQSDDGTIDTSISNEPEKNNPPRENSANNTANTANNEPRTIRKDRTVGLTLQDGVKVSERHRTQMRGLEMLAKKYGVAIEIAESIDAVGAGGEIVRGAANGKYENGVITIALDAVDEGYMYVATHELVHYVKDMGGGSYALLEDTVLEALGSAGEDVEALIRHQMEIHDRGGMSEAEFRAYCTEEVVANSVPAILTDEAAVRRIVAEDRGLAQKLADFFRDLAETLNEIFESLKTRASWTQMEALAKNRETIREMADVFAGALEEAGGNTDSTNLEKYSRKMEGFAEDKYFARQIDDWSSIADGVRIKVGEIRSGSALHQVGIPATSIYFDIGKIRAAMNKHDDHVTPALMKKIPEVLANPVAIAEYTGQQGNIKNTVNVYGYLFANGHPVTIGIVMRRDRSGNGVINHIRTIHARSDIAKQINDRSILYLDKDKKRTLQWFQVCGNSVPLEGTTFGLIRTISYEAESVKAKLSVKDDQGRNLTKEQAAFFRDSKVRDGDGNLLTVYHGTPHGGFTRFRSGSYFTGMRWYADVYRQGSAGLVRGRVDQNAPPETYEVYLNITKPFDTRNAEERAIFYDEYYRQYGTGADLADSGLPDWTDGLDLQEFIEENGYDYDGLILDEGGIVGPDGQPISRGLSYVTFSPEQVKNVDNAAPTDNPDIRFSLKDTTPASQQAMERLESENAALREALEAAKAQVRLTRGHRVSAKAVDGVAGKLLRETKSRYDRAKLAENLSEMFDYIANMEEAAWEDVRDMGVGMAREVLEKSEMLDESMEAYVAEARKYLRETAISLSDTQKEEAAYIMGGTYNDFRRSLFGRVRLANNGVSLESAWQDLSAMNPDLFPEDTNEADMPALLMEAADAMRPQYVNPYGYDLDGAAYDLFLRMYEAYFDLPEVRTYADKQAAKFDRQRAEFARKIADVRTAARDRYDKRLAELKRQRIELRQTLSQKYKEARDKQHKEDMERFRAQYRALSDEKNQKLLEQKAKFASWKKEDRAKREMSAKVQTYRKRIEKNARTLMKWLLSPTDAQHVPDAFRDVTISFLETLNFTGKRGAGGDVWRARLDRLLDQVRDASQMDGNKSDFYLEIDPDILIEMRDLKESTSGIWMVKQMGEEQLAEIDGIVGALKYAITTANRQIGDKSRRTTAEVGEGTIVDLADSREWKSHGKLTDAIRSFLATGQSDVFTYFDRLGPTAQSVLAELREGLDKKIHFAAEAKEFSNETLKGVDLRKITGKNARVYTFLQEGGELKLTKGQIMELYLLNQREAGRRHIYGKGIRPSDTEGREGHRRRRLRSVDAVTMTEGDVDAIIETLTQEERDLADKLGEYLSSTVSGWGNRATQQLYGYSKFLEKHYWPIRSDQLRHNARDPQKNTGLYALRNLGMTKATDENATSSIVIYDVFDTFVRHIDEMSSYAAFMVPISDSMRWYNYTNADSGVKTEINRAMGNAGNSYFIQFIQDLNGARDSGDAGLTGGLLRNAKVAAVGANIRVIIQQPTAYIRASAVMKPHYLLAGLTLPFNPKAHQLALKYAPIVQWKEWGYYDTNMGHSMRDLLIPERKTVAEWARDKSTWVAGAMDSITWSALWQACETEVRHTRKDLAPKTDAFYEAVGQRLSEVIDRTQVVDSVFHKSQIMRAGNAAAQAFTNFMAEPTKSYNMLMSSLIRAGQSKSKWKAAGTVSRAATAYIVTAVVNAAMQSFVDAIRDKEKEDEEGNERTYWDRWLDAFWGQYNLDDIVPMDGSRETTFRNVRIVWDNIIEAIAGGNVGGGLNPLNLIPYANTFMSLAQGYDAPRLDTQGISELINAATMMQKWLEGNSKWKLEKVLVELTGAVSTVTGIPVGNLLRDLTDLYDAVAPQPFDWESETSTYARTAQTLYKALVDGDKAKYDLLLPQVVEERAKTLREGEAERMAGGQDPVYASDADIVQQAKNQVMDDLAYALMVHPDIARAYEYREAADTGNMEKVYASLRKLGFDTSTITTAINRYANTVKASDPKTVEEKDPAMYAYSHLFTAVEKGGMEDFKAIEADIIAHSEAQNPKDAVKSQLSQHFRPLYIGHYGTGNTTAMNVLGSKLIKTGYFNQEALDEWVIGGVRDELWMAIDDGDSYEANDLIDEMEGLGRERDDIKSSVTSHYKPIYISMYNGGDREGARQLKKLLQDLDLYDAKGRQYYSDERLDGWINPKD